MLISNTVMIITAIVGLIGTAGIGGMFKTWLDHRRGVRKDSDTIAMAFAHQWESRVAVLEDRSERRDKQMEDERQTFAASLKGERDRCDVELTMFRHVIRGWKQIVYSMLNLMDMPVAQRKQSIERIYEQIAALEQAAAIEKGAVLAAKISDGDGA